MSRARRAAGFVALALLAGVAAGCGRDEGAASAGRSEALRVVEIDEQDFELYLLHVVGTAELEDGTIDDEARRLLRDELRSEMLLAAEAERLGIEPAERRVLAELRVLEEIASGFEPGRRSRHARRAALADAYVGQQLVGRVVVGDEDVEAALGPSPRAAAREYVVFRQIRVIDRAAADEAYRRVVRQKEAFEEVAAEVTTAADGGAPQQRALSGLPERVAGVIARVPEGTVSRPVQHGDAWYLFQVEARLRDPDPGRDRRRQEVRDRLFRERLDALRDAVVARLAAGQPAFDSPGGTAGDAPEP